MKLKHIILLAVVFVIVYYASIFIDFSTKEASAIGIIGGADGPTAIFIAGKISPVQILIFISLLTLIIITFSKLVIKFLKSPK